MRRAILWGLATVLILGVSGMALAQADYPRDALERYWECMERNDLDAIKELLWYHNNVEKIDATVYGLPRNDFDDQTLLTIEERRKIREDRKENGNPLPTEGPLQYPHHMRQSLDHYYVATGERFDCSQILGDTGITPPRDVLDSGWSSDENLTASDSVDRGEVDIAIDFANPNRIMVSSCPSGSSPDSSSNFIAYTSNWGQSWTRTAVGNNSGSTWECDPVSYYQRSTGRVYHSKIGCSNGMCSSTYTMMRYSSNNGSSWADCGRPGAQTSEDREWFVVDNTAGSSCYGNIYATWHNSNSEKVTVSTDNCSSWASPYSLTGTYQAITPDINVAADGHAYVVWQNYGDATFKIAGSDDCGSTWTSPSASTLKARLGDWSNEIPAQCQRGIPTQPLVDVDRASSSDFYGRVYVALFDFNQSGCGSGPGCSTWSSTCNYDIWFMYSDNEGSTWSTPVNLTAAEGNLVDHFMGYMRVDEADGSIYITYHRTRLAPTTLADRQKTHQFVMRSTDGGSTWESYQVSSLEGDERLSGASTFERGDYQGIDVYEGVVWPVWIDRRNTSGEEEIITRKVCTEPAHWSERSPTYTAPDTTVSDGGGGTVDISWDAPDIYWGDGGEDNTARKYQLWVDGSLAQDNISWSTTSYSGYNPGDSSTHGYVIRAVNQCGVSKDYQNTNFAVSGCTANPTVDVTPDGPISLCTGDTQLLTAGTSGGTSPFTYQWYEDGVAVGTDSSTYTASNTGTHTYNCTVTGSGCSTGVADPSATQITWASGFSFGGVDSVTNTENSTCTLDLAWTAVSSGCGGPFVYNIYRSTTSGFTPGTANRIASSVSGTSYSDTDALVNGTTYYYVVRAVDQSTSTEDTNTVEESAAPTGPTTSGSFSDDLESYSSIADAVTAGWSHDADQGTDDWSLYSGIDHTTGSGNSFTSSDVASVTDKFMISPAKTLAATSELSFWHRYQFETGYDGGVIEISINGGSSWTDLGSYITTGAYNDTISTSYSSPIGGQDAWSGTQSSFGQVVVNLSSFAGSSAQIRWRLACDSSVASGPWYIDDIEITGTGTAGTCTTGGGCTAPTFAGVASVTDLDDCGDSGVRIAWSTPSSWNDSGGLRTFTVYRNGSDISGSLAEGTAYFDDTTGTNNTSYTYSVLATNGDGCSSDGSASLSGTDKVSASPTFGGITSATDPDTCDDTGVNLAWSTPSNWGDNSVSTASRAIQVYRGGSLIATLSASSTSYNDNGGTNDTTYSYSVTAVNGCGNTNDGGASLSVADETTNCANTAPVVTITAPTSGATYTEGDTVSFTGTASDTEDGDLTSSIAWTSSIDGSIGSGGSFSTSTLSTGTHTITASVTDSGSLSDTDSISITVNPVTGCPAGSLDLSTLSFTGYAGQNVANNWAIQDGGDTIYLEDNTWVRTTQTYTITANTVIEFEFASTAQGEIHGIGFDADDSLSSNRIFKLYGTQSWGISWSPSYTGGGAYQSFTIPVGQYFTGTGMYLVFSNDYDAGSNNTSYFQCVRIYESTPASCDVEEGFESGATGWTNSGTCTTGAFIVGTPTLVSDGGVVTQVAGAQAGSYARFTAANSSAGVDDIDGGVCITTSPVYTATVDSDFSVWYFFGQRDAGDDSSGDYFTLEVSINGGAWTTLVSYGDVTVNAAWTEATTTVSAGDTVQLRVSASDGTAAGDLVEAGIDSISICEQ